MAGSVRDNDEAGLPPRVVGMGNKSSKTAKTQDPGKTLATTQAPGQLPKQAPRRVQDARRAGLSLLGLGVVGIFLPYFGLTFRGLADNANPQVAGAAFIVIGTVCLAVSRSGRVTNLATSATKTVLWLFIGLLGLIGLLAILALLYAAIAGPGF